MKVTLLQQDIVWADPRANREAAEAAVKANPDSHLYVLPEMWSTGFATQPEGIAETDGESLQWMQRMADNTGAAIAGSIATKAGGRYYNRFHFVVPAAQGVHYDKRHLFTYGGEHLHYTAGQERVVVEWGGARFLLQVCYDLRFPLWARNRDDYDAIIYVASWPSSRRAAWDVLLRARAIENQAYVFGVNRVGSDQQCTYNGGTTAVDPYGRIMALCTDDAASSVTVEMDLAALAAFRQKFPVLQDRDGLPPLLETIGTTING